MSTVSIEERVALLETEVHHLKRQLSTSPVQAQPWWEQIIGVFADTPAFDEVVRLGRQFREAQHDAATETQDDVSA